MPSFRTLGNKFFGNTIGTAAGVAAGTSTSRALDPILQQLANDTWELHAVVPPDAYAMALGVAQGQVKKADAYKWAKQQGIGQDQMDALVNVANVGPALGYAFDAWRRGELTDTEFDTALLRTGLEPEWFPAMRALKTNLLGLETLANLIQRGLVDAPFPLPFDPSPPAGNIKPYPKVDIDVQAVVDGLGFTMADLQAEVGLAGNPPGPEALWHAYFRGAITLDDVQRGLVEGRARGEWSKGFEAVARAIPSPTNYVEAAIRTRRTKAEMYAGAARHGMTPEDVDLLFDTHGRPATPHQVLIGLRRGGTYNGPTDHIPEPILQSMRDANLRPEYYNLVAVGLESYPPLFQLNNLVKGNAITADTAKEWAFKIGEAQEAIDALYSFWTKEQGGTAASGTAGTKHYTYSQIHQAWRHNVFTDEQAVAELEAIGYPAARATTLLETWKATPGPGVVPTSPGG